MISVVEGTRDILTRSSGIILNVPVTDGERRLARWIRQDQHTHIRDDHVLGAIGEGREEERLSNVWCQKKTNALLGREFAASAQSMLT